ncbi:hypothetical protein CN238_06315 [Sinorhizobium meliloti]|nr:hypothetical protein CN238_06315 [Sinorhizobium meliloti]RVH34967.1 hypothetical protein CN214_02495 [Sinorhizobium meliloti]
MPATPTATSPERQASGENGSSRKSVYRLHGLGTCRLQSLLLISVLVTEIQQRRVCGAGRVLSAQGLGLDPCDECLARGHN